MALAGLVDAHWPLMRAPYAAAWAAAIPWIVSGVSALASAYGAHKAGKAQNKAAQQQQQLVDLQKQQAGTLTPYGQRFLAAGERATNTVLPYYTKLATGDRNALLQTLAPQIQQIYANYDRPLGMLDETEPRGAGTTASSRMSLLSGRADALNRALISARLAGVQGLAGIGDSLSARGSGMIGSALGGLSGASSGNLGLLSSLFNIRNQNASDSEDVGAALADFLKAYQAWDDGRGTQTLPVNTSYWPQSNLVPASGGR